MLHCPTFFVSCVGWVRILMPYSFFCVQNCTVGNFSAFGPCNVSCGGGLQNQTRSVVLPAIGNGTACPALINYTACNTQPCPIDCVLGNYSLIQNCSVPCGGGYEVFQAPVLVPAQYGGAGCNPYQLQICNTQTCQVGSIFVNCSFACNTTNGTSVSFFNTTTLLLNQTALNGTNCTLNCTTLAPVDCQVMSHSWRRLVHRLLDEMFWWLGGHEGLEFALVGMAMIEMIAFLTNGHAVT